MSKRTGNMFSIHYPAYLDDMLLAYVDENVAEFAKALQERFPIDDPLPPYELIYKLQEQLIDLAMAYARDDTLDIKPEALSIGVIAMLLYRGREWV